MEKIKVLHIINNLGVGGAERVLLLLLEELSKKKDIEIYLVSLEGHGELEDEFKKLPINFKKFHFHLFNPFFRRFELYFRLRLFLYAKKVNPNIIHGHLIKGEDFAKVLGGLLNKPVLTTSHDCYIHPGRKQKWLNRYLTKAIAVSEIVKDHLVKVYGLSGDKIIVIPNGIRSEEYRGSLKEFSEKKPVFMYLGRLIEKKGVQFAIEGLSSLVKEFPGIKFLIFGDGPYRADLERIVREKSYDFVEFRGLVKDVPGSFREGDVFILPSKSEGFSMGVLEAIASGKPVIATKTGAIPGMVEEGINGYFVEYGKAKDIEISGRKILDRDISEMQLASLEKAKDQFDIEIISKKYYNLYLIMLGEKNV